MLVKFEIDVIHNQGHHGNFQSTSSRRAMQFKTFGCCPDEIVLVVQLLYVFSVSREDARFIKKASCEHKGTLRSFQIPIFEGASWAACDKEFFIQFSAQKFSTLKKMSYYFSPTASAAAAQNDAEFWATSCTFISAQKGPRARNFARSETV